MRWSLLGKPLYEMYAWFLASNNNTLYDDYDYDPFGKEIRIKWGSGAINTYDNLTADGIEGLVPECNPRHVVDPNTIIVFPDTYPRLDAKVNNQFVYPLKVQQNAKIYMTEGINIEPIPCNDHVNIMSKVLLGIINNEARMVFFPTLSCFGSATDGDVVLMLRHLLTYVKQWYAEGKNVIISPSISLYRQIPLMNEVIEQILSYPNVAWDIAAGNRDPGLNYCERSIYAMTPKYKNLAVIGRTRLAPAVPNVLATDTNYGPCVAPYGPGDLTYKGQREWGTSFVKEFAAVKAALWAKYPTYTGVQITELAMSVIRKIVESNLPNDTKGLVTVFSLGSTCAPINPTTPTKAPTKNPTHKVTNSPTSKRNPTFSPTFAPTLQNFGTFSFNASGGESALKFYAGAKFCLAVKFANIASAPKDGGLANFNLADGLQQIIKEVSIHNPKGAARFFQLQAADDNLMLFVYRGRVPNRVLAQTHVLNGEQIQYLSFGGKNSKYTAEQCNGLVSPEYEDDHLAPIKESRSRPLAVIA